MAKTYANEHPKYKKKDNKKTFSYEQNLFIENDSFMDHCQYVPAIARITNAK